MPLSSLTALISAGTFSEASCWGSKDWMASSLAASGVHISSYVREFCTPDSHIPVLPGLPLTKNWTIGDRTLEIAVEVNQSKSHCREASFTVSKEDLLCYTYLNELADQCSLQDSETSRHGSLPGANCTSWSLVSSATKSSPQTIAPRAMTVSNWDKFYHKGKGYMQSLDQRLQDPKAQDANQLSKDELYSEYDVRRQTITGERLTAIDGVKKSDRFYGIIADYKEHESLYYHNFFGTRPGVIIAAENKGYFKGDGKSTPERWSAVIGSLWAQVCAEDNQPISGLRRLVRTTIENEETKDVLQEAFDRAKVNMDPSSKSRVMRTFTRKDEAFYAIIGTPNGNGVPWLLKTNADRLGKKTITSIAVYANLDPTDSTIWLWDLIFAIEKASAEESSADRAHQETGANADPPEVDPDNDYSDDCGCSGLSCLIL